MPAIALAAILAVLLPAAAAAQTVTGHVRNNAGDPVAGAMVLLLHEGRTVHAALSNEAGAFALRAPRPGTYGVRAEGIGYRTAETTSHEIDAQGLAGLELVLEVQPISLAALQVTGANQCRVRPEEGVPAYRLWEEAAKALRSAALLQDLELIDYTVTTWEREVSLGVRQQHTETHPPQRVTGRPFVTRSPELLAEEGYVEVLDGEVLYHGPDAHVLLSDAFLDTHCLRVERRGAERPGLVGIAFEPARGRALPDIEGVLWLDEATAELQYVTYDYTGLGRTRAAPAIGRIDFTRLPAGGFAVDRWWIRMMRVTTTRTGLAATAGYLEMGGEVTDIIHSRR